MSNRNHEDDARHITVGRYGPTSPQYPQKRLPLRWTEAVRLFFHDNKMSVAKKLGARYLPALLATAGIADDATPIVGLLDEPLTVGFLAWCLWRINKYRKTGK
jgi:hypothetical protein